jgi:hypothetical protein
LGLHFNLGENSLSKINQSSCAVQESISVELALAIATISQASVEEISQALKQVPCSATAKIVVAIGRVWQQSA